MGDATQDDDDPRWITVDGRRWRATDPSIPDALRSELVDELMAARRAVADARGDAAATARARARVQNAKVALGERGEPWWEPTEDGVRARLASAMLALAVHRTPGTTCPSDAARAVGGPEWRRLMAPARELAGALAEEGVVRILQRGEPADVDARGPIRIGLVEAHHD